MAHVLVVEDNLPYRKLLGYRLEQFGHTACLTENGIEALKVLEHTHFDLAILDISMPDMDGLTLLMSIRETPKTASLPVMMLTASALDAHQMMADELHANLYMQKYVSSNELREAVEKLLSVTQTP
ncbi:MAG TPA: response regulator [Anaerolineales bacterium]|nr:response regulator [Anaerolineales bacterium]